MKKLMIIAILLIPFVWVVAQKAKDGNNKGATGIEERAQLLTDRMAQSLELNEFQKKQIFAINLQYFEGKKALRGGMKANREATMDKHRSLRTTRDLAINEVLNQTQALQLQQIKEKRENLERETKLKLKPSKSLD